jgi:hypothetical protein
VVKAVKLLSEFGLSLAISKVLVVFQELGVNLAIKDSVCESEVDVFVGLITINVVIPVDAEASVAALVAENAVLNLTYVEGIKEITGELEAVVGLADSKMVILFSSLVFLE